MNELEKKIQKYFNDNGFPIEKVTESSRKTPDFEGKEILVEVKSIHPQDLNGLHKDSTYNAIKSTLRKAAHQFREYDPKLSMKHIVIIFSENIISMDVFSVITGMYSPMDSKIRLSSGMTLSGIHKKYIGAIAYFKKSGDSYPSNVWLRDGTYKKYFPKLMA